MTRLRVFCRALLVLALLPVLAVAAEKIKVTDIQVKGNKEIEKKVVVEAIKSRVGDEMLSDTLKEDIEALFSLGYFADVKANLESYQGGARVVFSVVENPVVKTIEMKGFARAKKEDLLKLMKTREGRILNNTQLKADVEAIERFYQDTLRNKAARMADVEVTPDGVLKLTFSEGVIEEIRVSGNSKTKAGVVLREMETREGEVFESEKLQKDLRNIYNLGFFEDVKTDFKPGTVPGNIVLEIQVEEAKTGSAGFGAGYSSTGGLLGFLELQERNFRGKGQRASTKVSFGGGDTSFDLNYYEPWLDNKRTSGGINLVNNKEDRIFDNKDVTVKRVGGALTFGRPIGGIYSDTRVSVTLKSEDVDVRSDDPVFDVIKGLTNSVGFMAVRDGRDNFSETTKGSRMQLNADVVGGLVGGDFDFQKYNLDLRTYRKLGKKGVLAARGRAAAATGQIPRFEFYDLGGVSSLRGYEESEFQGTKLLLANLEYRLPLGGNLGGVAFVDSGKAFNDSGDIGLDNLHSSVGLGIRFKIPAFGVGPVRLDYAQNLDDNSAQFHFGIGHMF